MLLIDADIIAVRSAVTKNAEAEEYDGLGTDHVLEDACEHAENMLSVIMDHFAITDILLCWSDPSGKYFRHDLYESYKSARKDKAPVILRKAVRGHLEDEYPSVWVPRWEGDDVMGLIATDPTSSGPIIVVSADKDMMTVPGITLCRDMVLHDKDGNFKEPRVHKMSADHANLFHMLQCLTGDACDSVPGLRGYGEVKPGVNGRARKALSDCPDPVSRWERVVQCYAEQNLSVDIAIRNAQLLAIRHYQTRDDLWHPPT